MAQGTDKVPCDESQRERLRVPLDHLVIFKKRLLPQVFEGHAPCGRWLPGGFRANIFFPRLGSRYRHLAPLLPPQLLEMLFRLTPPILIFA
jgi:hypothetical protein